MNPIRSSGYCDNCGMKAKLEGMALSPNKPYPTAWYCESCAERFSKGWIGSTEPTVIDGSKCIPTVFGVTNNIPSVWIELVSETEIKFRKELLEYLLVTARMAEDSGNDELAWRIWQAYGRLEDFWSEKCQKQE